MYIEIHRRPVRPPLLMEIILVLPAAILGVCFMYYGLLFLAHIFSPQGYRRYY